MTVLLVLIYVAFISLGIPDSLLGAAWPAMHVEMGASVSYAGILSTIIAGGTVVSSFCSARLIARFGTARVTAASVLTTAVALLGFSLSGHFYLALVFAVPLGLGAGSVDAALNNFVALHYQAKHMNWLHCFWGIGATLGPAIIGAVLAATGSWRSGYSSMAILQGVLAAVLFLSLPLWKKAAEKTERPEEKPKLLKVREVLRIPLALPVFLSLFCYTGVEASMGLWGASFLVTVKGIRLETAAAWVSTFYLGITAGRFIAGFLSLKLNNPQMVRLGEACALLGTVLLLLPLPAWMLPGAFFLVGAGFAPIYPAMLHETPKTFGGDISQAIMGIQMAIAYMGNIVVPPLFGAVSRWTGMALLPWYMLCVMVVLMTCTEYVGGRVRGRERETTRGAAPGPRQG